MVILTQSVLPTHKRLKIFFLYCYYYLEKNTTVAGYGRRDRFRTRLRLNDSYINELKKKANRIIYNVIAYTHTRNII